MYGDPILRKVAQEIDKDYDGLNTLIANMFETMYNANGLGLAAPQIGKSIRLFIVDATPFAEKGEDEKRVGEKFTPEQLEEIKDFKRVFINPKILKEEGIEWKFNEGCLSIPKINEDVSRQQTVTIEYHDENFKKRKETYSSVIARIIQHEYDHIEGKLFTDRMTPFKRKLLAGKLNDIAKGKVDPDYKVKFYKPKK
jgi:peptide deformylase